MLGTPTQERAQTIAADLQRLLQTNVNAESVWKFVPVAAAQAVVSGELQELQSMAPMQAFHEKIISLARGKSRFLHPNTLKDLEAVTDHFAEKAHQARVALAGREFEDGADYFELTNRLAICDAIAGTLEQAADDAGPLLSTRGRSAGPGR